MGGKKGKERRRDIKGKEVRIHLGYIFDTFTVIFTILRQPSGNHLATKRQPKTLGLISRDRIGPLATVANSPGNGMIFYQFRDLQNCKKESPEVTPGFSIFSFFPLTFSVRLV